jgi:hypothetical protein
MTETTQSSLELVLKGLDRWDNIDGVNLAPFISKDPLHPYFFISLDIFYSDDLPSANKRKKLFAFPGAFESSLTNVKDRFFIQGVPIRLEYKSSRRIEEVTDFPGSKSWVFRENGSYGLYRIKYGDVLKSKDNWLETVKAKLDVIPDHFWTQQKQIAYHGMEHSLSDLMGAASMDDEFTFTTSKASCLNAIVMALYGINKKLQPSPKQIGPAVLKLSILPEHFKGRYMTLIGEDETSRSRVAEVAHHLVESILRFSV